MISVSHLVKRYGAHVAVNDVSFEVGKGEIVGFLGPNGAGKSTTLRILSGFLGATSGEAIVNGYDVRNEPIEARRSVGYMPEATPLYPEMRVAEYLTFRAELKGVERKKRRAQVDLAMDKTSTFDVATTLIGHLSKGYKQRVGLADALVSDPPILILDEPTAGLDPNQIRDVRDLIKGLSSDHSVLLSTHILSEVEQSCGRVVVIAKGKLLAEGRTSDIQSMRKMAALVMSVRASFKSAKAALSSISGIANVTELASQSEDEGKPLVSIRIAWSKKLSHGEVGRATEAAVLAMVQAGHPVREVRPAGSSLEEVFAELTRGADDDHAADGSGDAEISATVGGGT